MRTSSRGQLEKNGTPCSGKEGFTPIFSSLCTYMISRIDEMTGCVGVASNIIGGSEAAEDTHSLVMTTGQPHMTTNSLQAVKGV